eukprot:1741247-Amphidinium_carterae.1
MSLKFVIRNSGKYPSSEFAQALRVRKVAVHPGHTPDKPCPNTSVVSRRDIRPTAKGTVPLWTILDMARTVTVPCNWCGTVPESKFSLDTITSKHGDATIGKAPWK